MRRHRTEKHRGQQDDKEKVNFSDLDNTGDTIEHKKFFDKEETDYENDEDVDNFFELYWIRPSNVTKQVELISCLFTTSPDGRPGGWPGGWRN